MNLVVSEDATHIQSVTLYLTDVKCPTPMLGALELTYTQPTEIVNGKFTIKLTDRGMIQGELMTPTRAEGTANLFLTLPNMGIPDDACDLGQWKWQATP